MYELISFAEDTKIRLALEGFFSIIIFKLLQSSSPGLDERATAMFEGRAS